MDTKEYIRLRAGLRKHIDNEISILKEEALLPRFNITSANLIHLLPKMALEEHEVFFREILFHQKLSTIEQDFYNITDYITTENLDHEMLKILKEKPSIICTFHSGSYRVINTFLLKNQVPYCLVVAGDILKRQGDSYRKGFDELYDGYVFHDFAVINAELPSSGLAMLRELKKGRSLVVYIDGNTGVHKNDHSKSVVVSLLNGELFVKTGISFIAHLAGVPIIPVICYRKSQDDIRLKFFDPLIIISGENRREFGQRINAELYRGFESILVKYPEQWEGWLYIHQSIVLDKTETKEMSNNNYGFFRIHEDCFLFDKLYYRTYLINAEDYDRLDHRGLFLLTEEDLQKMVKRVDLTQMIQNATIKFRSNSC